MKKLLIFAFLLYCPSLYASGVSFPSWFPYFLATTWYVIPIIYTIYLLTRKYIKLYEKLLSLASIGFAYLYIFTNQHFDLSIILPGILPLTWLVYFKIKYYNASNSLNSETSKSEIP